MSGRERSIETAAAKRTRGAKIFRGPPPPARAVPASLYFFFLRAPVASRDRAASSRRVFKEAGGEKRPGLHREMESGSRLFFRERALVCRRHCCNTIDRDSPIPPSDPPPRVPPDLFPPRQSRDASVTSSKARRRSISGSRGVLSLRPNGSILLVWSSRFSKSCS